MSTLFGAGETDAQAIFEGVDTMDTVGRSPSSTGSTRSQGLTKKYRKGLLVAALVTLIAVGLGVGGFFTYRKLKNATGESKITQVRDLLTTFSRGDASIGQTAQRITQLLTNQKPSFSPPSSAAISGSTGSNPRKQQATKPVRQPQELPATLIEDPLFVALN